VSSVGQIQMMQPGHGYCFVIEPFIETVIEPLIHSDACICLAQHRTIGNRVLIISASGVHLVVPIAQRLGVEHVLAIELEQQHGGYSGRTLGVLTYREGKVSRLLEWLQQHNESLDGAYFYSDSRNDLPLLEKVSKPHAVNPASMPSKPAGRSCTGAEPQSPCRSACKAHLGGSCRFGGQQRRNPIASGHQPAKPAKGLAQLGA
jgi:hypothetical protein